MCNKKSRSNNKPTLFNFFKLRTIKKYGKITSSKNI